MSPPSFGRCRTRTEPKPSSFVKCGVLLKKRVSDNSIIQTINFSPAAYPFNLNQVTWDDIHTGPPFKTGGPFASIKAESDANSIKAAGSHKGTIQEGWYYWEYHGGFIRPTTSADTIWAASVMNLPVSNPYQVGFLESLDDYGPEAYNRARPKIGEGGAFQFLAEMRQTTKMLRTSAGVFKTRWEDLGGRRIGKTMDGSPKAASNHFLNHHFGWVPFIKDLSAVLQKFEQQQALMEQMSRDNGNWMKRARTIEKDEVVTAVRTGLAAGLPWRSEFDSMCTNIHPDLYSPYRYTQIDTLNTSIWCAGQFSYYRPEFDMNRQNYLSYLNKVNQMLTLYGVRINPSNLWKIMPWSWLIDWFTGFGAWLAQIQALAYDGVVAKYFYVMKRAEMRTSHTVAINWNNGLQLASWSNSLIQKQREEANNPFGWTLPGGGLTAKQYAILAALGLSRRK